jgi:hypothetical protein
MSVLLLCFIIYSVCRLIKKPDKIKSIIFHIILTSKTILKVNFFGNVKIQFSFSIFNHHTNSHPRIDIYIINGQEAVYIYIFQIGRL